MPLNGSQLSRALANQADAIRPLIERYQQLARSLDQQLEQIAQQGAAARLELARLLLPDIEPESVARVERLAGFSAFRKRDPKAALAHEQSLLVKRIARVEGDERYRRREYLVGSVGEHTRALEEARGLLQPWELECERFEKLDGFHELIDVGYDTPAYTVSWLEGRYWRFWSAGDRICRELGMADFGDDVLPAYLRAREQREQWRRQVGAVEGRISEVHDLVREHDELQDRLVNLPTTFLAQAQGAVAEHLAQADLGLVAQWIGAESVEDRALTLALRRAAGLAAKLGYLEQLRDQAARARLSDLKERESKLRRKAAKLARPKYAGQIFADSLVDPALDARLTRLEAERDTVGRVADAIVIYDAYDRFSLDNPADMWWWEMTGERPPRALPELRSWYDRNPNLAPTRDDDEAQDAVGEAASATRGADSSADFLS